MDFFLQIEKKEKFIQFFFAELQRVKVTYAFLLTICLHYLSPVLVLFDVHYREVAGRILRIMRACVHMSVLVSSMNIPNIQINE